MMFEPMQIGIVCHFCEESIDLFSTADGVTLKAQHGANPEHAMVMPAAEWERLHAGGHLVLVPWARSIHERRKVG